MFYTFMCPTCDRNEDVQRPVAEASAPGPWCCGEPMRRVFNANFSCDELRSTQYWHPDRRVEKFRDHGRVYDAGLGKWYSSWSERKRLVKEAGLKEHGITGREL